MEYDFYVAGGKLNFPLPAVLGEDCIQEMLKNEIYCYSVRAKRRFVNLELTKYQITMLCQFLKG